MGAGCSFAAWVAITFVLRLSFLAPSVSEMSQYVANKDAEVPIERYDQLVAYFEGACKPRERWRIGTEYEKVAVWAANGHAVPFTNGIEEILRRLLRTLPLSRGRGAV